MITRTFLGWERPLLERAAAHIVECGSSGQVCDLGGEVIVVPGSRAGRRLKEHLLAASSAQGVRLKPPRLTTVGHLPELFYHPRLPIASPLISRRSWAGVLRTSARSSVERVFGELPERSDVRGWELLAAQMARLQEEVGAGGHRFADVAERCAQSPELYFDDSARWELLAQLQGAYELRLQESGFSDRHLERIAALGTESIVPASRIWLVGIAEFPVLTKKLLERTTAAVIALIQAPAAEAESFDRFGCVLPNAWRERPLPIEDDHLCIADGPGEQAAAVLGELSQLGNISAEEVVIGAADEALVPYLEEWLGAAQVPVHFAGGYPIERSAPYRLLAAVAAYLERRDWESFAALVRHPAIEARIAGSPWDAARGRSLLEGIDRFFAEHLPASVSGTLPEGTPGNALHLCIERLESDGLLGRMGGVAELRDWPERILDFLVACHAGESLDPADPEEQGTIRVLTEIRTAALDFASLPDASSEECAAPVAIRLLLDELRGRSIPKEPDRAAVELLGWLEVALDDAPVVLVTGVNEPALPQSINADPFLPDRLRSHLGLLDNARRYARDAFHVCTLVGSRRTVRFVSGRRTAEGDPLQPSRLLLARQGDELAQRILWFHGALESAPPLLPPLVGGAGERSEFVLPPEAELSIPPVEVLSVTDFKRVLEDPYLFVLERLLRLTERHDRAREMDGLLFGGFLHRVLNRFGHSTAAHAEDEAEIHAFLEEALDLEADRSFGATTFPAVRLQLEQLRVRLKRFAGWQAARRREGWRIVLVEGVEAGEWRHTDPAAASLHIDFDVDGVPVRIQGRIDRIDYHPEQDRWALLDYKASDTYKTPEQTHFRSKRWVDLQLPLYRHLAGAVRLGEGATPIARAGSIELGYILLTRELNRPSGAMASWSEEDLEGADEAAREVVRLLRQGSVAYDPAKRVHGDAFARLFGRRVLVGAGGDGVGDDQEDEG